MNITKQKQTDSKVYTERQKIHNSQHSTEEQNWKLYITQL